MRLQQRLAGASAGGMAASMPTTESAFSTSARLSALPFPGLEEAAAYVEKVRCAVPRVDLFTFCPCAALPNAVCLDCCWLQVKELTSIAEAAMREKAELHGQLGEAMHELKAAKDMIAAASAAADGVDDSDSKPRTRAALRSMTTAEAAAEKPKAARRIRVVSDQWLLHACAASVALSTRPWCGCAFCSACRTLRLPPRTLRSLRSARSCMRLRPAAMRCKTNCAA